MKEEDKRFSWIGSRRMSKTGYTEIRSWHDEGKTTSGFDLVVKYDDEERVLGTFDTLKEAKARQNIIK